MSLHESKILKTFTIDGEFKTLSVGLQTIITDDIKGEIARNTFTQPFEPGQIEDVKTFLAVDDNNPYIILLNALWTNTVIQDWINKQNPLI